MQQGKGLRITVIVARILLGFVFFAGGVSYFFMDMKGVDFTTPSGKFTAAMMATGYFLPFLKATETMMGFLLFFKRTTPLALIVLAPIILQINLFHGFLMPSGLPLAIVLIALEIFLAWAHWDKYESIFKA
jgi:putative oxidoreductase